MGANSTASAWLDIDLDALAANYRFFQDITSDQCHVAGILKADAYGIGMQKALAVFENMQCPFYFVATLGEALALRGLTAKPVAVLDGLFTGAEDLYIHHNLLPVLNGLDDIMRWNACARRHSISLPAILHFDTGMNRLGMDHDDTARLLDDLSLLAGLQIVAVMSHFSCADDKDHPETAVQSARFAAIADRFPQAMKSLANSSGIMRSTACHYDLVRPGMAVYGLNPTPETDNPMRPVIRLSARILQIRKARKNETVGYGQTHHFNRDRTLATVAVGYGDGFPRYLGNRGTLYYKEHPCPIVGRVSMDLTVIDVSDVPAPIAAGDVVEVIGARQSADDLAKDAGTIGYEILTALGRRYHRRYDTKQDSKQA